MAESEVKGSAPKGAGPFLTHPAINSCLGSTGECKTHDYGRPVYTADEKLTLLERVLQLHGDFRRSLDPIRVTPFQAGVLLFLSRYLEARVTDVATALRVRPPTLTDVVKDLVRKRWVTKHRSVSDTRVVHLRLSRQGNLLTRQIEKRVHQVSATLAEPDRRTLGMIPKGGRG